ncbi:MAG: NRDE family protein [Desulfobacteraceae bacterium]|nr:MAG: NRDE family protein [Desulfobacteraceae bacterium]
MCLILMGVDTSPNFPFILAANRDEFYNRPTAELDYWQDQPDILAGRDLVAGGTWLGVHTSGRFAALTNYRDPADLKPGAPSRGEIIPDCLLFGGTVEEFLKQLENKAKVYTGFNLVTGELLDQKHGPSLFWFSNQGRGIKQIPQGFHGVSNHLLNTAWPKVTRGTKALSQCLKTGSTDDNTLFELLKDRHIARDDQLPQTGVGPEWERILSPMFIQSPTYGTRSSTLIRVDADRFITITERTYDPADQSQFSDRCFTLPPGR